MLTRCRFVPFRLLGPEGSQQPGSVLAAGLDQKDDKHIELSLLINDPQSTSQGISGTPSALSKPNQTLMLSSSGVNITEALSKIQSKYPNKIYWGHNNVFIVSQEVARQGIHEHLEFILQNHQAREHAFLFVSEDPTKQVLDSISQSGTPLPIILQGITESEIGLNVTVVDLLQMLSGKPGSAILPWVVELPSDNETGPMNPPVHINGSAVFKLDKLAGHLEEDITRGVMWVRNEIQTATVTFTPKDEKGEISIIISSSTTRLIPKIKDEKWSVAVKIDAAGYVMQNTTDLNLSDPNILNSLEKDLEQEISHYVEKSLDQVQKKYKTDVLDFSETFHRKYPRAWKRNVERWNERFPEMEVDVAVNATILRTGKSGAIKMNE